MAGRHDPRVQLEQAAPSHALAKNETPLDGNISESATSHGPTDHNGVTEPQQGQARGGTKDATDSQSWRDQQRCPAFLARVARILHATLGRCCVPAVERQEFVQSTLVKLTSQGPCLDHLPARSRPAYASKAALKTYLNARRMAERRQTLEHEWAMCHGAEPPGGEEQLVQADLVSRALEILEGLPEELRAVLVACELQGLSHAEAADALGLPLGTVKSRHRRARVAWRQATLTKLREEPG